MYLDHFGLSESPFRITPHTDFFFSGANRGATLEALLYAITHDEGIVKVSGEVGSGKTMLCRVLMERLPENVDIVYLANPSLSREDILFAIGDELGLDIPDNARPSAALRALQEHLVARYAEGRQVVVLIDEAHAMPVETLEEIRLLSNLESNRHKLLQLVLFGQPELNDVLARQDMRQLKERITHNFTLEPLVRDDIAQYLDFRMRAAGYRGPDVFSPAAVRLIATTSTGLTRRINILADKALLAAFASGGHQITPKEVKAAIRDSEFANTAGSSTARRKLIFAAGGSAFLVSVIFISVALWPRMEAFTSPGTPLMPSSSAEPAHQATIPAPPPSTSDPIPAKPEAAPSAVQVSDPSNEWHELGPVSRERLSAAREWLSNARDERWFAQLARTDISQANHVESVAAQASKLLATAQVRVYAIDIDGSRRIGVIYGDYPTQAAATAAIARMPKELRLLNPFPRQVKRLR